MENAWRLAHASAHTSIECHAESNQTRHSIIHEEYHLYVDIFVERIYAANRQRLIDLQHIAMQILHNFLPMSTRKANDAELLSALRKYREDY